MFHSVYEAATGKDRAFRDAAGAGDLALVTLLLEGGQCVDSMSKFGATALHKAAGGGHLEVVQLLVNSGASVKKIHKDGRNAVDEAELRDHTAVVTYLRAEKQKYDACDRVGVLALTGKELFQHAVEKRENGTIKPDGVRGVGAWFNVICRLAKVARAYKGKDIAKVKYNIQKLTLEHRWFMDHINAMDLPELILSCDSTDKVGSEVRNRLTRAMPAADPSDDGSVQVFLPGIEGAMTTYVVGEQHRHRVGGKEEPERCTDCTNQFCVRLEYYAGVKMPTIVKAGDFLIALTEMRSPVGDAPLDTLGNNDDRANTDIAWKVRPRPPSSSSQSRDAHNPTALICRCLCLFLYHRCHPTMVPPGVSCSCSTTRR
jgi:hypothetical protein